jgi:hypothetical protein
MFVIYGEFLSESHTFSILQRVEYQIMDAGVAGYGKVMWTYLAIAVF